MLAAYRVYGKGEALTAVAADTKLDEQALQRWVEYLKVKTRPELAKWHAATDANRKRDRRRSIRRISAAALINTIRI